MNSSSLFGVLHSLLFLLTNSHCYWFSQVIIQQLSSTETIAQTFRTCFIVVMPCVIPVLHYLYGKRSIVMGTSLGLVLNRLVTCPHELVVSVSQLRSRSFLPALSLNIELLIQMLSQPNVHPSMQFWNHSPNVFKKRKLFCSSDDGLIDPE